MELENKRIRAVGGRSAFCVSKEKEIHQMNFTTTRA